MNVCSGSRFLVRVPQGFVYITGVPLEMLQDGYLTHILNFACPAGYCIDQVRTFACKVLFACIYGTCCGADYFPPLQVWTVSAFAFVYAVICYESKYCSNVHKGGSPSMGQVLLTKVPFQATICY